MAQNYRYCTTWIDRNGNWQEIMSTTKAEALQWHEMVEKNCKFKSTYDIVSGNEIAH